MEGLNEICTAISSKNIQLLQSYIATYRKKLVEVVFVEGGFLYKKISKKDVYVDYGATADIPQDAVSSMEIWQHWRRWNKLLLFLCKPEA